MKFKFKNGILIFLNLLGVVAILFVGSFLLSEIESIYDFIGDKVPILGKIFAWAERVVN